MESPPVGSCVFHINWRRARLLLLLFIWEARGFCLHLIFVISAHVSFTLDVRFYYSLGFIRARANVPRSRGFVLCSIYMMMMRSDFISIFSLPVSIPRMTVCSSVTISFVTLERFHQVHHILPPFSSRSRLPRDSFYLRCRADCCEKLTNEWNNFNFSVIAWNECSDRPTTARSTKWSAFGECTRTGTPIKIFHKWFSLTFYRFRKFILFFTHLMVLSWACSSGRTRWNIYSWKPHSRRVVWLGRYV